MAKAASLAAKGPAPTQSTTHAKPAVSHRGPGGIAERVSGLQRSSGNGAVARVLGSLAANPVPIGPVDDSHEREAARIAESMAKPAASGAAQPKPAQPFSSLHFDPAVRQLFESRFGMDLRGVRIHTGSAAGEAARSLDANAFTVGSDIVFGEGKYAPGTGEGRRLIAHEVAHVAQQSGSSNRAGISGRTTGLVIQREVPDDKKEAAKKAAPATPPKRGGQAKAEAAAEPEVVPGEFGPKYKGVKSRAFQLPYEKYKASIGTEEYYPEAKAASKWGGTPIDPAKMEISEAELREILNPPGKGHVAGLDETIESYRSSVNIAFSAMELDTVEAQAVYLAHAAGETGSFAKLEEKATVREKDYMSKGFGGRGPVQVTEDYNYLQTLGYLEHFLEGLREKKDPRSQYHAAWVQQALDMIKADPANAADPKYTFLFSAAFMHMAGGVKASASLKGRGATFAGDKPEDSFVNSKRNHANELKEATAALASLKTKQDDPEAKDKPTAKKMKDAQGRVNEATTNIGRSKIKAATYREAVRVLSQKALTDEKKP